MKEKVPVLVKNLDYFKTNQVLLQIMDVQRMDIQSLPSFEVMIVTAT